MRDTTQRETHVPDLAVRYFQRRRDTDERECITGAIAHLSISGILRKWERRKSNRSNQFTRLEIRFRVWRIARKAMKGLEGNRSLTIRTLHVNDGSKRRQQQRTYPMDGWRYNFRTRPKWHASD